MPQRIEVPFVGGAAVDRQIQVNNQATVNLMQAIKGRGAKSQYVLESAPGLVNRSTLGDGAIRTSQMISSRIRVGGTGRELYGVFGSRLMAMTTTAGDAEIGTLSTTGGRVSMARGRTYIMLVDGTSGYTYDGTTFAQIADLDFPDSGSSPAASPTHCLYLDGFFIVNDANMDNFYISALEDPTSWNALDFEAAAVAPDNALAIAATESLLWIIGDETAQAYYNSGNPDFPYQIVLNATQETGILAPQSIAESDDGIFYLATTPEGGRFVYQIQGTAGRVISMDEQEAFLDTVTDPTDAYAFIYKQAGKSFYVLQLSATTGPNARSSSTLVYNIKARSWETRELLDGTAWRVGGHGILNNQNIGGSRLQAQSLTLDLNVYRDLGQELVRRRRTQIMHNTGNLMRWWGIIIDVAVATTVSVSTSPAIKLRYSNDAGRTWSDWLFAPLGNIGDTDHRVYFRKLGIGRRRVWEIECSEDLPLDIIAAYADVEILRD